jgi:parallel beta-helix repeat protein
MKTTRKSGILMVLAVGLVVVFAIPAFAQDEPPIEDPPLDEGLEIPGIVEGTGTYFEVTDSEYLNITLTSSEPVNLRLESVSEMVVMDIEAAEGATSTEIILTGFEPLTTYYKYEDDYYNEVAFTTDEYGSYTYAQDIATAHLVFIQPQPGTWHIPKDTKIGDWNPDTKTFTLTTDVYETIQIDSDGIILDGDGHSITGGGGGFGVYLPYKNGVTIQNLNVQGFPHGIYLYRSSSNTMTGNTANSNNSTGIFLSSSSNNTMTGNNVSSNNKAGIYLHNSSDSTLSGNTASNSSVGIYLDGDNNTLTGNTVSNNQNGITLSYSNSNILIGNTASSNTRYGIYLRLSSNNTLTNNTTSNNQYGIYLYQDCSNNTLTGNTASNNKHGIMLSYSDSNILIGNDASLNYDNGIYLGRSNENTLTGNTTSNNANGILLSGQSDNNTLTGNTANLNYQHGIYIATCSTNIITGNTISDSYRGISLKSANNNILAENMISLNRSHGIVLDGYINTLTGNTISNNGYGIYLDGRNTVKNQVYNNNFISNTTQAYVRCGSSNLFNLDKPVGGNYWSDWTTPDDNADGFVDEPYIIISELLDSPRDDLPWTMQDGWDPIADADGPYLVAVDESIMLDGSGSYDPSGDTLTYMWTQDNEVGILIVETDENPIYIGTQAGITNLMLTVSDGQANVIDTTLLVVYDPDGGFVTGGGWIDSPEGAYKPDPLLAGKANFGFVSKYKKGTNVPTGNTEFLFKAGDLNFHSSSYNWLVVTGSEYARFKGSGSINGEGDFKFMLWAGDKEPDTFRIKIWEEDESENELVIYDNGMDQEIGGGSIIVHTK